MKTATNKKGRNVRLNIFEQDEPRLEEMCTRTGLNITAALSMILHAGLEALESEEYRVTLPIRFTLSETPPLVAGKPRK